MKLEQEEAHISTSRTNVPACPSKMRREVMEALSHAWVRIALTSCRHLSRERAGERGSSPSQKLLIRLPAHLGLGGCKPGSWGQAFATDNQVHSVRRLASKATCLSLVGRWQSEISKWCQILLKASTREWSLASLEKFHVFQNGNRWASRKKSKRRDGDPSPHCRWPLWRGGWVFS